MTHTRTQSSTQGDQRTGESVPSNTRDLRETTLQAAMDYAALGWPVVPGAVWRNGHFADPVNGGLVTSPSLLPLRDATTDVDLVRKWWSAPGLFVPNVLTAIGPSLGGFTVLAPLAEAIARHPLFEADPTPALAIQDTPFAYFLVRPPMPAVLLSRNAQVLAADMPMPLPPSALGGTEVVWLITPREADNTLMAGDELADLIQHLEGQGA